MIDTAAPLTKMKILRYLKQGVASGPASPVLAGSLSAIGKDRITLIEQSV